MGQTFQARTFLPAEPLPYVPQSAIDAGQVVVVGKTVGVTSYDTEANAEGSLNTEGIFVVVKDSGVFADDDLVYWNPTGNPVGGTAGSGCATLTPNNRPMGKVPPGGGADADDETVQVRLGDVGRMPRIPVQTVAAAGTNQSNAAALAEGFNLVTGPDDTKGVVLPSAAPGMQVIVKLGDGADLKVWPASGDAINAITADSAITIVDDVCVTFIAVSASQWYTTPLLPS